MSQGWASPSAADWLNPGSAPSPEDHSPEDHSPADLPAARYRTGNLIGSGGMGVVRVAHDTILGRDVAFKQLHPGQNSEQTSLARLAREARITARLEHPGIVAIHDAGTLADGTPYYTMRLIRGQTLRALLTETQTGRARERFLRPLLSACEAVAFAHAAGMVHRDLKPDNILIGPFGEVQVVDWGLASPWRSAGWEDLPPLPTADTSVGTPAYMSPEQARGAVPRPEADVWALGATLYEVIIGRPAFPGPDPAAILLALREGAHPHIPEDISPELAAILRRAMAAHPEDRYPDAAALSEDLASFFEGRRVRAYTYSTWDLALRLFRAWRRPILGVTAALAILVTLTSVGVLRIESERERAVAAEAITQAALVTSRNHLSQVLVERAVAALREGRRGEAELRAVESLLLQENPSARGVLAAFAATPRARLLEARPAPACEWARFDPHNPRYLCGDPAGLSLYSLGVDTPIWRISGRRWDGQFLHDGAVLSLTEARFIELRDSGTGEVQHTTGLLKKNAIALGFPGQRLPDGGYWGLAEEPAIQACTRQANWLTLLGNAEAALVVCQEGSVIREDLLTGDLRTYQTPLTGRHEPGMPLVLPDQHTLLLTSIRGRLLTLDLTTGTTVHTVDTDLGIIRDIALSPDQRVMLAVGERGRVALWDLTTGNLWGELPDEGVIAAHFVGPREVELLSHGALRRWSIVGLETPHRVDLGSGIADVETSPTGNQIAFALGSGQVILLDRDNGGLTSLQPAGPAVAKAVAWSPESGRLAHTDAKVRSPFLLGPDGWSLVQPPALARRITFGAGNHLFGSNYIAGITDWDLTNTTQTTHLSEHLFVDLEASPDGRHLATVSANGEIWRWASGETPAPQPDLHVPSTVAIDISQGGRLLTLALQEEVRVYGPASELLLSLSAPKAQFRDVTIAPGADRIAAAGLSGEIWIWSATTGKLQAILPGHTERISSLDFGPDGYWLASGSWDHTTRIWDLSPLERPASDLAAEIQTAYALPNSEPDSPVEAGRPPG